MLKPRQREDALKNSHRQKMIRLTSPNGQGADLERIRHKTRLLISPSDREDVPKRIRTQVQLPTNLSVQEEDLGKILSNPSG